MVDLIYKCSVGGEEYNSREEAEKCESRGLIGPELEPGLLLAHKRNPNGFMILYNELKPEGHERIYHVHDILNWRNQLMNVQRINLSGSRLNLDLRDKYKKAIDEQVELINKRLKENCPGSKEIMGFLEQLEIKELHNRFNLESYLKSIK